MIPVTDVAHVMVNVTDIERSLKFYRDILGFTVSGDRQGAIVWMNIGQYKEGHNLAFHDFAIYQVPNGPADDFRKRPGLNHVAFRLNTPDEVDKAAEHLKANNVKVLKGPLTHDEDKDRYLYFEDPDGNVLELVASTLADYPDGYLGKERREK